MYLKKYLNEIGELKSKDPTQIINESMKGALIGASVGAGVGLIVGLARKKNLILSVFIGGVLGAGITKAFKLKNKK